MLIDDLTLLLEDAATLSAPALFAIGIAVMVQSAKWMGMPTVYATPLAILIALIYFVGFTWPDTTALDVGQGIALGLAASGTYSQWKKYMASPSIAGQSTPQQPFPLDQATAALAARQQLPTRVTVPFHNSTAATNKPTNNRRPPDGSGL